MASSKPTWDMPATSCWPDCVLLTTAGAAAAAEVAGVCVGVFLAERM